MAAAVKIEMCKTATAADTKWLQKIRPEAGHDTHFHVRLKCPQGSAYCQTQKPTVSELSNGGNGCDETLAYWVSDAYLHPKPVKPTKPAPPPKPRKRSARELLMSDLPAECAQVLAGRLTGLLAGSKAARVAPLGAKSPRPCQKRTKHEQLFPAILAMACVVVASNILVQHPMGAWLTWGALTYPLAFLVNDITNRLHGTSAARRVVLAGFVVGLVCSVIGTQIMGEFGPLSPCASPLGSLTAFLVGQMLDIGVFNRYRQQAWWRAPLISTVLGSTIDTALFFTIAFAGSLSFLEPSNDVAWAGEIGALLGMGPAVPFWVSLAVADWCVKFAIAVLGLLPFRLIVAQKDRRDCVKPFDKHKICVTIPLSATILKGGDPVSRVILESGVGTVGGMVF